MNPLYRHCIYPPCIFLNHFRPLKPADLRHRGQEHDVGHWAEWLSFVRRSFGSAGKRLPRTVPVYAPERWGGGRWGISPASW